MTFYPVCAEIYKDAISSWNDNGYKATDGCTASKVSWNSNLELVACLLFSALTLSAGWDGPC